MAWDAALSEMVLVTSAANASGRDVTWVWSGAGWKLQPHGAVAPDAFDLPMAFDPVTTLADRGGMLLHTGITARGA